MHFSSSQAIQSLPASAGVNTIYIIPNEGDPIYSVFHNVYDLVKWVYVVRGGNIGSSIEELKTLLTKVHIFINLGVVYAPGA
jgi:hypothetical protein